MAADWSAGDASTRARKGVSQSKNAPIAITPSHVGKLHSNLGIAQSKPIPTSKLSVKPTDSSAVVKEKTFAKNARKWGK